MRFILDTVGKAEWPGGKIPEDWSELVRKHNDKAASDDNDGSLKWIDERVPPGRDVRCIVSVAMLAEGWDANTVTHIVGFASVRLAALVRAGRRFGRFAERATRSMKTPRCSPRRPPRFSVCPSS